MNSGRARPLRYVSATFLSLIWIWNARDLQQFRHEYDAFVGAGGAAVFYARWILTAASLIALVMLWRAASRKRLTVTGADLRALIYLPFAALGTATLFEITVLAAEPRPQTKAAFMAALLAWMSLYSVTLTSRRSRSSSRLAHILDVLAMNAVVVLLASESALHVWGRLNPSPLFTNNSAAIQVKAMRGAPGSAYFDSRLNSSGYHDDEFFTAGPGDLAVAVLADSFGLGVVPYDYNFVTVAERRLREVLGPRYDRVALHNFGIPAIDPDEYAYLLETEVMRTNPALVVLAIFVGNDIQLSVDFGKPQKTFRYSLTGWLVWNVASRARNLFVEIGRHPDAITEIGRSSGRVPPHIRDPELERPSMSEKRFLEIESDRLEVCNPVNPLTARAYVDFLRALAYFADRLGDRLIVMVIPDELQVNDSLYQRLTGGRDGYDRDYPQRTILEFCTSHGVDCLDLLPALRQAQQVQRTYHLQDTHWNANGNRVGGELLAEHLLQRIGRVK